MKALAAWRPFPEVSTLHHEIDDLFTRFFGDPGYRQASPFEGTTMIPVVESFARNDEWVVRADLPGMDPKDVELSIEGDRLTITGERKVTKEENGERGYREVRYGRFERSVALPAGVDPDSVKATYHDGVLEMTMKAPKGFGTKKVPITVH